MSVSNKIKSILSLCDKPDRQELADYLGISRQSLNNKFSRDSFSIPDLLRISQYCGGSLQIQLPNDTRITFTESDLSKQSQRKKDPDE